jgi:hypothetical protein
MVHGLVYDDVPYSCQLEILDHEVCLLQSADVWHVLAICSVFSVGEQPLRGSEDVLMYSHRGTDVLCEVVEVVTKDVDSEAFARAFVMFELGQVL